MSKPEIPEDSPAKKSALVEGQKPKAPRGRDKKVRFDRDYENAGRVKTLGKITDPELLKRRLTEQYSSWLGKVTEEINDETRQLATELRNEELKKLKNAAKRGGIPEDEISRITEEAKNEAKTQFEEELSLRVDNARQEAKTAQRYVSTLEKGGEINVSSSNALTTLDDAVRLKSTAEKNLDDLLNQQEKFNKLGGNTIAELEKQAETKPLEFVQEVREMFVERHTKLLDELTSARPEQRRELQEGFDGQIADFKKSEIAKNNLTDEEIDVINNEAKAIAVEKYKLNLKEKITEATKSVEDTELEFLRVSLSPDGIETDAELAMTKARESLGALKEQQKAFNELFPAERGRAEGRLFSSLDERTQARAASSTVPSDPVAGDVMFVAQESYRQGRVGEDEILTAVRKEVLNEQLNVLQNLWEPDNPPWKQQNRTFEEFLKDPKNRDEINQKLNNPQIKESLEEVLHATERDNYQNVLNKFKDRFTNLEWTPSSEIGANQGQVRTKAITNDAGEHVCDIKEETVSGIGKKIKVGNEEVEIKSHRQVTFPIELAENKGPLHFAMALKDANGRNMPEKEAVYFTAHYDEQGKLVEITSPQPIKFAGEGKDAVGYIERNGKVYTLPVNKGMYESMMLEVEKNKGMSIDISQTIENEREAADLIHAPQHHDQQKSQAKEEEHSQPQPTPVVEVKAAPQPQPAPVVEVKAAPQPQPAPVVEVKAAPQPQPAPVVELKAAPQPQPAPVVEAKAAPLPQPAPVVEVKIAPLPQPTPIVEAKTAPMPESKVLPEEVKHDAANIALSLRSALQNIGNEASAKAKQERQQRAEEAKSLFSVENYQKELHKAQFIRNIVENKDLKSKEKIELLSKLQEAEKERVKAGGREADHTEGFANSNEYKVVKDRISGIIDDAIQTLEERRTEKKKDQGYAR